MFKYKNIKKQYEKDRQLLSNCYYAISEIYQARQSVKSNKQFQEILDRHIPLVNALSDRVAP